eukprot:gene10438-7421_t
MSKAQTKCIGFSAAGHERPSHLPQRARERPRCTSSVAIMAMLKTEASAFGKSVVAIARNEIFELVDELLVLKAGWTMNCGSCRSFL